MDKPSLYFLFSEVAFMEIVDASSVGKILFEWRKHSHICWEILICIYGEVSITFDLDEIKITSGDVLIIPPDMVHSLRSETGWMDKCFYVDIINSENVFRVIKNAGSNFIDLTKRLYESFLKEKEGINCSFVEKSRFFLRHVINLLNDETNNPLHLKVRNYINNNFADSNLSEDFLSKYFDYNGNYLRRNFKENYGTTPMQYLAFVRLTQAKNLLEFAKNYSISEIGLQCGFNDQLYFSRFFKKHTGSSPTEYRLNARK